MLLWYLAWEVGAWQSWSAHALDCGVRFSQSCCFSGLTLLNSSGLCIWPPLLLHGTCSPGLLVMLPMLPCHGQDEVRFLFIPKEGLTSSLWSHRLGAWAAAPPVVLRAPSVLNTGRPTPYDVRGSWVPLSS